MLASVIDSFLDLLSGAVLFVTRRAMDRTDIYLYPQGKRRLEPVGVVVFATVMAISALQIVREAAQRYGGGEGRGLGVGREVVGARV
jgi:divalent metal cation (Fe/Co/Zn/Cd) transporter